MPENILASFLQEQRENNRDIKRFVLGFSGGLDSTVLLHLMSRQAARWGLPLCAVHVHHGLSKNADSWAEQSRQFADSLQVPLQVMRVKLPAMASLEAAARQARYQAFADCLQEGDVLVLAQHQDDQAETLFLRLLRGSGITGLAAMRAVDSFPVSIPFPVPVWRPLLVCSRLMLEKHARQHGLSWVEDESNQDESLNRNFLRQRVVPLLKTRWPALAATLSATTLRMQEADALLDEMAEALAQQAIEPDGSLNTVRVLSLLHEKNGIAKQRLILRYWLQRTMGQLPASKVLEVLRTQVLSARDDGRPSLHIHGWELKRYRQRLYAVPVCQPIADGWETDWPLDKPLTLPDGRMLFASSATVSDLPVLRVTFRQGGEVFFYHGHRRELKKIFQETGVPPWERERLPLLWQGEELLAVLGTSLKSAKLSAIDFDIKPASQSLLLVESGGIRRDTGME